MLELQPISFKEACYFVDEFHSHHSAPQGHKYSIAVNDGKKIVGVIIVGRPVSRYFDDSWTLEVTRCCTNGIKNAASFLYAAAWRTARAMGYKKLITYTLPEEKGTSLIAAGYKFVGKTKGQGSWDSRPRKIKHPTGQKLLWAID